MTSGYQYLKEKVEKYEKLIATSKVVIEEKQRRIEDLEQRIKDLEDEAEALVFNRMVNGIRELTGWQEGS